jgi:urease accessory protein
MIIATIMRTAITTTMTTSAKTKPEHSHGALPLLVWLSPAFPVGSFAYSHGLEWAFEAGDVNDAKSTARWIGDLLNCGGPWSDAVLLACAHRAASAKEFGGLREVAEFAAALAPSRERKLETMAQGAAFISAARSAWNNKGFEKAVAATGDEVAYPVAVGIAAAAHNIPLNATLDAYLLAVASNLVSAAVRLIPLGQTDGIKIVANLMPLARSVAERAAGATLDEVGGAAIRSDIASMKHETQYTRLFRS